MSPTEIVRVKRLDSLTPEQEALMPVWRDRWIEIGLRTGPADRAKFEKHVADCYRAAGLAPPQRIVWVPSPFVLAFAAPAASLSLEWRKAVAKDPRVGAALLRGAPPRVGGAVHGAVDGAVRGAVGGAVDGAVDGAVREAVDVAVRGAVDGAVGGAVREAVHGAVGGAVDGAVHGDPVTRAVVEAIRQAWPYYVGGQFWPGWGWGYWGPAAVSFLTDACGLDLGAEMDSRARAYAGTVESACWWWPHREFVMVSERPVHIDRDARGRLHSTTRKAIEWPDGWGVYRIHGTDVPEDFILNPEAISIARIDAEKNAELRRIMTEIYGTARFMRDSGATLTHEDGYGRLYERRFIDGARSVAVHVRNSTVEPDGTVREFWLRVHPELRPLMGDGRLGEPQSLTARNAVASTFGLRGEDYQPSAEA